MAADQRARLQQAMIELVAADGYDALTVRALAGRARISSGAFYTHYRSTDDCLLSTFDHVCRGASEHLLDAAREEQDPHRRLACAVDRLLGGLAVAPQAATFMLRAAPAAGPAFAGRLRDSAMRLGVALEYCLRSADGPRLPPQLLEGIVAGLARVGRVRVLTAGNEETGLTGEVCEWILSLCPPTAAQAEAILGSTLRDRQTSRSVPMRPMHNGSSGALADDRAMILAAAFRIAKDGYHQLSVPRICREAGVSRRSFNRYFQGVSDCIFAAVEDRVSRAIAASARKPLASANWSAAVYEVLETLCEAIEADEDSARVLFVEIFTAGERAIDNQDRLISRIARALRATAPEGKKPSELAAEASTAAAWAILRRRVEQRSAARESPLPSLALLILAPAIGGAAALRTIEVKSRNRRQKTLEAERRVAASQGLPRQAS